MVKETDEQAAARLLLAARYERGLPPDDGWLGTMFTREEAERIIRSHGIEPELFMRASAAIIHAYEAHHGPWIREQPEPPE